MTNKGLRRLEPAPLVAGIGHSRGIARGQLMSEVAVVGSRSPENRGQSRDGDRNDEAEETHLDREPVQFS